MCTNVNWKSSHSHSVPSAHLITPGLWHFSNVILYWQWKCPLCLVPPHSFLAAFPKQLTNGYTPSFWLHRSLNSQNFIHWEDWSNFILKENVIIYKLFDILKCFWIGNSQWFLLLLWCQSRTMLSCCSYVYFSFKFLKIYTILHE